MTSPRVLRPDELLAHRPWVRALARSLVRDEHAAADLEQDTWVRALSRMPERPRSIRAWLGTVMRNRLRDRARSEGRRARREQAVATADRTPAAADIAARADVHRHLIETVLELGPADRDVILMRYFEGLSSREASARLGIAASTLRSRLTRALDRLRARLDAAHGGERERWKRALAPLLISRRPRAPLSVRVVAIGLVLTLVAVFAVHGAERLARPPPSPAAADAASGAQAEPERRTDGRARVRRDRGASPTPQPGDDDSAASGGMAPLDDDGPVDVELPVGPARSSVLVAVVVDSEGVPVESADVEVLDAGPWSGAPRRLAAASTDEAGRAPFDRPRHAATVRLAARRGDRAALSPPLDLHRGVPGEVRLTLAAGVPVRGIVLDSDGEPAPGARIALSVGPDHARAAAADATTDAHGAFDLGPVPLEALRDPASLYVRADGHIDAWRSVPREDLLGGPLRIALEAAFSAVGRCVDEEGRPVAGVRVSSSAADRSARTGPDGRFALSKLHGGAASLTFESPRFAARSVGLPLTGRERHADLGDVVLLVGRTLDGTVVREDGSPVAGAHVVVFGTETGQVVRQGESGPDGTFAFEHVGDEPHTVTAAAPGRYSGERARVEDVRAAGGPLRLVVTREATLLVRLVDAATGDEVAVRHVTVRYLDDEAAQGVGVHGLSASESFAEVRIPAARPGVWDVRVETPGFAAFTAHDVVFAERQETVLRAELRPAER